MLARGADALAAWNRGDPEGIAVNMAEDVIWRDVALGMPLHGRDALQAAAQAYMTALPGPADRGDVLDAGAAAAGAGADRHRHAPRRAAGGAAHRPLDENYAAVVDTFDDDGMMIEGALYWNALGMLRQLGLDPPVLAPV